MNTPLIFTEIIGILLQIEVPQKFCKIDFGLFHT